MRTTRTLIFQVAALEVQMLSVQRERDNSKRELEKAENAVSERFGCPMSDLAYRPPRVA